MGKAPSILRNKKIKITERQLRRIIQEFCSKKYALSSLSSQGNTTVFSTNARNLYRFMHEVTDWERRRVFEVLFGTRRRTRTSLAMMFEDIDSIETVIFEGEEGDAVSDETKAVVDAVTEDEPIEVPPKNFVIMVGGPGTGKGGVINTDKFMGQTVSATKGVMAAGDYLKKNPEFGVQIQDEVDGFLRIEQRKHADEVWKALNAASDSGDEKFQQALSTLVVADNAGIDLRPQIGKALGKDWNQITAEDWKNSELSSGDDASAMVGASAGVDSLKSVPGGVKGIKSQFMLLRSPWGKNASDLILKKVAVENHGKELKGAIEKFVKGEVESDTDEAGNKLPSTRKKKGVYILDSAGEDLPSQDYEGQLRTAKNLGFNTYIIWLNTGPEVSYVGNLERSVTGGKRAVPPDEIKAYYDAAESGVGPDKDKSARDYFTSLTKQEFEPDADAVADAKAGKLLDKVLVLNQKDDLTADEIEDIAIKTCVNPAGFDGKNAGDSAGGAHNINNDLCSVETAEAISGMDLDFDVEQEKGAPTNYSELVDSLKDEILSQVKRAIKGAEILLPSAVTDIAGDLKGSIQSISDEYSKKDLKGMSKEEVKIVASDLGVDIDDLANETAKQVQDDRQNAIRGLIKMGKGGEFETEEIGEGPKEGTKSESTAHSGDVMSERWQRLAGIIRG